MRLAIITTHPIQYYAPVFKLLAQKIDLMVFYTWGEASMAKHDPGFGRTIKWDIDLLDGYNYQWVNNKARDPGTHHFIGIDNPDLISQITNWQPDELLVYGWAFKSHLSTMRHFKNKIPVLFRGDSTLLDEKPGFKNLLRAFYLRWVYKYIDYALYTGTNNKAYFKKYGLSEKQLIFVPHSVDNERFANQRTNEVAALKQQLNISHDDLIVLFAGKLEKKKDPEALLRSFINLAAPGVHLLFVGNGFLEKSLKERAARSENIHFMDFQNQNIMPVVYQACDIFCLPSAGPGETWGLAVNEAMACAKAILASDKVGCAVDLVNNEVNGCIHEANSEVSLSEKLSLLIYKTKQELSAMGLKSAQFIKNWDINIQADNIVNYKR
ncbi:glycosyltransferase family 4 protein [Mucilaginibacter sp. UR6-11]|uniref:glycosyltransferase family 4 protein n=1 Tax=Mucilaginibacter sp. UR6-11 TaxID=1435644 RepID=UPI001E3550C7|nr:glycosyltransferase family 4 protein [Mucilaginibacter sp. UR6-11]MCC8425740.1 glycosyltransferase family 4 protein [Mucilaginibacter sp. UR6-11]